MPEQQPTGVFSFFSGTGFLDLGFEDAGFEICLVNEIHKPFLDAYQFSRKNLGKNPPRYGFDRISLENYQYSDTLKAVFQRAFGEFRTVGFIGGPPCPDFSIAGKNNGENGDNGRLSKTYVDLICDVQPHFFLFENVKGLYKTHKHRAFFEQLKKKLEKAGYTLFESLINSIEYGAPQDRDRIILIGVKTKITMEFEWQGRRFCRQEIFASGWPTTESFRENSVRKPPKNLPLELTAQYWFSLNEVTSHPNAVHHFRPKATERFNSVAEGDTSKKSYKRLHRWRYSPTVAYGNNEVHLHPYKARRLTVAEALSLQSLPKAFQLPPDMTLSNMFKTIGNGVPYLAGLGLAQSIKQHLAEVTCS